MALNITFQNQAPTTVLCIGVHENGPLACDPGYGDKDTRDLLSKAIQNSTFKGKISQSLTVFTQEGQRLILIGLGVKENQDKSNREIYWQKIGSAVSCALQSAGCTEGSVDIHDAREEDSFVLSNIALGTLLRSWRFEKYFTKKEPDELFRLTQVTFQTTMAEAVEKAFSPLAILADSVFLTRSLVTEPGNVVNPETLALAATSLQKAGVTVEILEESELKKLGMGALLGVGQGSAHDSKVAVMRWDGGQKGDAPLAFVGKGVTFDSGGLSLKSSTGMEEMKDDMGGAGVVIGLMQALALRKAKINCVGVIALVENMPSSTAQRPGDVVTSLSGQTIEVLNTDAEGRLILADALWYTQDRFKPKLMIDLATLTGAMVVCLGKERAGLFATDDDLANKLLKAGETVDELLWRLPLDDAYDKEINSNIADMKNISGGRGAGSITAAKFLQRFVNNVPWAHLDIAGVTLMDKDLPLSAKGATAFGVRLLNRFVEDNYEG